jgi:hypothetical protein
MQRQVNKMMTRKDYIAVAEILNAYHLDIDSQIFEDLLSDFQTFFKRDNSNFDLTRFRNAVIK